MAVNCENKLLVLNWNLFFISMSTSRSISGNFYLHLSIIFIFPFLVPVPPSAADRLMFSILLDTGKELPTLGDSRLSFLSDPHWASKQRENVLLSFIWGRVLKLWKFCQGCFSLSSWLLSLLNTIFPPSHPRLRKPKASINFHCPLNNYDLISGHFLVPGFDGNRIKAYEGWDSEEDPRKGPSKMWTRSHRWPTLQFAKAWQPSLATAETLDHSSYS